MEKVELMSNARLVMVTPELAKKMLSNAKKIKPKTSLSTLEEFIKGFESSLNNKRINNNIIISCHGGVLIEGHSRLEAIIKANTSTWTFIETTYPWCLN